MGRPSRAVARLRADERSDVPVLQDRRGVDPATVVAQTKHLAAFRDIKPQAPSHVLVIPRRHVGNVAELAHDADELADLFVLAGRVADEKGSHRGYRMVANTGSQGWAKSSSMHHVHVLGGRRTHSGHPADPAAETHEVVSGVARRLRGI